VRPGLRHGFNIHFEQIVPRETGRDHDRAEGPGALVRSTYLQGGGVPSLIAVYQNASGQAREIALSYASANGGGRAGVIETTFREECENRSVRRAGSPLWRLTALIQTGSRPGSRPATRRRWPTSSACTR